MIESRLETSEDVTFADYLKVIEYKTATAFEVAARTGAIIANGAEEQIEALTVYGKNIGIAYQIRDDLLDWKNEDKLFNLLIKKSLDPRDVFDKMEELLKEYSEKARDGLRKLPENDAKINLDNLIKFTSFKGVKSRLITGVANSTNCMSGSGYTPNPIKKIIEKIITAIIDFGSLTLFSVSPSKYIFLVIQP